MGQLFPAEQQRLVRLLIATQRAYSLSPGELLALGAGLYDYQDWLSNELARVYDELALVEIAIKRVYKEADALDTMPQTIN